MWGALLLSLTLDAAAQTQGSTSKPLVDKQRPVRGDFFGSVRVGSEEKARVLLSFLTVLDTNARQKATYLFDRLLVELANGKRFAFYREINLEDESSAKVRKLAVDAESGAWLLATELCPVEGPGYGRWASSLEDADADNKLLVTLETRRLRVPTEWRAHLGASPGPFLVQQDEPELMELMQEVCALLGPPAESFHSATLEELAREVLGLKLGEPMKVDVKILERRVVNDEPELAPPMNSQFEKKFGRWATWRQLPVKSRP